MPAREFFLNEQESFRLGPIVTFITIPIYLII